MFGRVERRRRHRSVSLGLILLGERARNVGANRVPDAMGKREARILRIPARSIPTEIQPWQIQPSTALPTLRSDRERGDPQRRRRGELWKKVPFLLPEIMVRSDLVLGQGGMVDRAITLLRQERVEGDGWTGGRGRTGGGGGGGVREIEI